MTRALSLLLAGTLAACGKLDDHAGVPLGGQACWSCHGDRYLAATAPNHVAANLPQTCESCHSTLGWQPAEAGDHDRYWPLTGQHRDTTCASCHVDNVYSGTPRECVGCHEDDFVATTQPDHELGDYPRTCEGCHTTAAWRPATFDHDPFWPLTGRHVETECTSCHADNVYLGTPRDCVGCHLPDYQATTRPAHTSAGYPTTCAGCHSAAGWVPATFGDHDQFWPLEGDHALASCESCHAGGVYAGTPRECVGCHRDDYDASDDPPHAAAGFATTCASCHGVVDWVPSTFDHDAAFALNGAHQTAACVSCHADGVYQGTPRLCYGCHAEDYQASTNPSHTQLALATTCINCHNETSWTTDTFPGHDTFFRTSSGKHSRFDCTDCHKQSDTSWAVFTCTGCHTGEHNLARMNQKHQGEVNNYQQTISQYGVEGACLHCHPDGRED